MNGFKMIGKGRAIANKTFTGFNGKTNFKFKFYKGKVINFERMKDQAGIYFRVYPAGNDVKYDTCNRPDFERLFHTQVEWGKPWPRK